VDDPLHYPNLDEPVGSGPFALVERMPEKQLVLRNTRIHHNAPPSIDTLVVEILRDESKALQALKDGKLDMLGWGIMPSLASDVRSHPDSYAGIKLATAPGLSMHTLLFNLRKAPYDNEALRWALAQALDTQAIIDKVLLGFGDPGAADLFPSASQWHDASIAPVTFDPQRAMARLTAAGFLDKNGDGLRENPDGSALQISITCAKQDASLQVAGWITASWKAVGVGAKASPVAPDQVVPTLMQAKFDVVLHSVALSEPEMAFFYFHSSRGLPVNGRVSGFNYGGYANPQYDQVAEAMQEEQNAGQREALLHKLQQILAADLPHIPLYSAQVLYLYRDDRFVGWSAEPGIGLLSRKAIARLSATEKRD
jgi:peptide/nickel transport system substrate-binding protein